MIAAHIHLILNHLPVLGVLIAGAVFLIALGYRNVQFQRVALGLLVLFALAAIPVYLTGEPAEQAVERLPGVSEAAIDRHERAASIAFAAMEGLGGLALLGMLLFRRATAIPAAFAAAVLVLALGVSGLFGWTGYLGGQIRHTEVRAGARISGTAGLDGDRERGPSGGGRAERSARAEDDDR